MKFLIIDGALLRNKFIRSDEKMLICFLLNLAKQQKCFWGQYDYLADIFGSQVQHIVACTRNCIKKGFIVQTGAGLTTTHDLDFYINYIPAVHHGNSSEVSQSPDSGIN